MLRLRTKVTASPTALAAQVVGHLGDQADLGAPGAEEGHDLRCTHLLAQPDAGQDLGYGAAPVGDVAPRRRRTAEQQRGRLLTARAPRGVAGQALGVGGVEDAEAQRWVQPALGVEDERRVDGQPRGERVPGRLGGPAEHVERRPGPLRVHVVGGDGGHAAPVVDACVQQGDEIVGEVRGSLDVDLAREHQACRRDGPLQVLGRAGLGARHGGAGLGEEVLDDDLLDVAVAGVRGGDGPQRRQLPGPVVPDPHQDPRGEGDGQLAGGLERGQPSCRVLVGRAPVRSQALGERLDHGALAGRDGAQPGQLVGEQRARVGVGEQPGLLQDEPAHLDEVVDRGRVAVGGEPVARHRVAELRPLAQREERLMATRLAPGPGDGEDLLGGEIRRVQAGRRLGEGAVAAAVAAQHGERDEDLGGEGDPPAVRAVAHRPGQHGQIFERRVEEVGVGEHQRQSRGLRRGPARPPAAPCAPRAPGPPAGPRREAAPRPRPPWTARPP